MKIILFFSAFLVLLLTAEAQNDYIYLYPKPNSVLVSNRTNIILRSGSIIDKNSLNSSLLTVSGSKSGIHTGTFTLSDDGKTIVFNPTLPFYGEETVTVQMSAGVHTAEGVGLPGHTYTFTTMREDAIVTGSGLPDGALAAGAAPTQYLPAPPITIDSVNNPAPGYIFLATWDRNTPQHVYGNYLFILDRFGNILDSTRVNGAPFDFKIQPNGRLSYGLGAYTGITPGNANLTHYVLDSSLAVVDSFQMKNGYLTDFHDFILLPNGHAMLMSYTTVTYDMSRIVPGGRTDAQIVIDIFQEQDANKNVVFEWRDIDYIPITDTDLNLTDLRINPSTLNAFDLDNDGNLLLCFRNHSDVMKINRGTGEIMWKWGGLKNQFTFIGEHPENAPYYFARQHNIKRLPNGNVSIFDNGEFHSPWYSRAAEYQLDETNKTATLVSEYRYAIGNIQAQAAGNAEPVPGGGWFIGFGILMPTTPVARNIVETHADGSIAFELSLPPNVCAYRVSKQPWRELVQRIKVSKAEVMQGNTYNFSETGKNTGVAVKYLQLAGDPYNSASITRIPYGPVNPEFISESPLIYPVSVIYEGAAISSHLSEIQINLNFYPEIKKPAQTEMYMREFRNQGLLLPLGATYDSAANKLIANTNIFGEIVFGAPDAYQGSTVPVMIEPLNKKKILSSKPATMKWSGRGMYRSFNLQLSKDSLFTNIVLDTTTTNSFVQKASLAKDQNYYWRVRANIPAGAGDWSQIWSFVPTDAFVKMLSPNGGESLEIGDTTIIRWDANVTDSVRIELIQSSVNLGVIGKSAGSNYAFQWIIPAAYLPNNSNRLRIYSIINGSIADTSDAVFSIISPSGIDNTASTDPNSIQLSQNYPNPFNSSTKIHYTLPQNRNRTHAMNNASAYVQLKVYDILGNEVAVLVNREESAGSHEVIWDAGNLPSGLYYYRIQSGEFVSTKKMLLLK